jgi:hypothetical protein
MMLKSSLLVVAAAIGAGCLAPSATAQTRASLAKPGVVSHVKVLSDKVEDVSSLEAWKRSFIKDGMSEEEKAKAIWKSVVSFQHQDQPPNEFLQTGDLVLDPIKGMNVYGYSFCSVASANVICLARSIGMQARGWTIDHHVVSEINYNGGWRMLDSSLITWFPQADGHPAGVEEIVRGVKEWSAKNPEIAGSDAKLREFMRGGGWRKGPEVLSRSPFYDNNGWLPAATHGWYATMQEYSGKTLFPYEAGYSQGYEVNVQLREGERLTRNWSNEGMHIDMNEGKGPGALRMKVGQEGLRYAPQYGDLAPGRVGNGVHEYNVPLASGAFLAGALVAQNLIAPGQPEIAPAVRPLNLQEPGVLVLRMPSSYVYLGGEMALKVAVGEGDKVEVWLSQNNGLNWAPVADFMKSGEYRIDLKPHIFRRYDYQLKFILNGKGTGLDALRITHPIQHSQRPLPALAAGENRITLSADNEGTVTIEGSMVADKKQRQLHYTDFHPERKNIDQELARLTAGSGEITFPIETPGDMTRLRIGAYYRARDARDVWEVQVSFDGGKTFEKVDNLPGPFVGMGKAMVVSKVPAGTRAALVRFSGTQRNTLLLQNARIDADYREPQGGFRPVKISYAWEENGQAKQDVHIARQAGETYTIACGAKPMMKSITVELAE